MYIGKHFDKESNDWVLHDGSLAQIYAREHGCKVIGISVEVQDTSDGIWSRRGLVRCLPKPVRLVSIAR